MSHGFQAGHSPSAEPAATGHGGGRTGGRRHSCPGCRTDSALAAQVSGLGKDLEKREGTGWQVGVGGKVSVKGKDRSARTFHRGS